MDQRMLFVNQVLAFKYKFGLHASNLEGSSPVDPELISSLSLLACNENKIAFVKINFLT